MLNLKNIAVADNRIDINGVAVGMVTDAIAEQIIALIQGVALNDTPKTAAAPKPKASANTVKAPSPKAKTSIGYVVSCKLTKDIFDVIREDLKDKGLARYVRKLGFVFQTKASADKYMAEHKDVTWRIIGER